MGGALLPVPTKGDGMKDPREAIWLEKIRADIGEIGPLEIQLLNLMHWVGRTLKSVNPPMPTKNPLDILDSGIGWCEQQVKVFLWCANRLYGVKTREVALYHTDGVNGHSVAEVFCGDRWLLFDVHSEHQSVYRHTKDGHIMGYLEICANVEQVVAEQHPWRGTNGQGKEGFYATAVLHPSLRDRRGPGAAYCNFHPDDWV